MEEVIEARFSAVEQENTRQNHRIDNLEKKTEQIPDIVVSIKEINTNMSYMIRSQDRMESDIVKIKEKPANYWEKALWVVIVALIGYALKSVGV